MKKTLLTAAVAALSFSTACNDPAPKKKSEKVETVLPAIASKTVPEVPTQVFDAGFIAEPTMKDVDVLALPHEDARPIDHLARATELRELGDFEGALAEARRAIFDDGSDLETLTQLDRLTRLTKDHALRVVVLERLATVTPEDALPVIGQARVLLSMKDYEGAIRVGTEATKRDANNPEAWQAIGRAHLSLGQLEPAIATFEKVVSLDPNHGYALNNLGFSYLRANLNEQAVDVLTRAAELLPHVAYVHNNLGVALERTGRLDEAKEAYARSSHLSPKYLKAQLNSARVASVTPSGMPDTPPEVESELPEQ